MLPPVKASEKQHVTGDWVLFHPVYTPSELKAVEVGSACAGLCGVTVSITVLLAQVLHRSPQTLSDKFAYRLASLCR